MLQRLSAHGLTAEYPVAYAVGAGKVGFSYLISLPPYLFQSPVSYYSQASIWDVTPGYEHEGVLDFTHPIAEGCVFCHSNKVNLVPGTENQFREPALAPISCERCHGDTTAHLAKPVAGSIINPARLPQKARDSVCEQCHLEGEARILNPGKHWQDFHAGAELETVFSTYLQRVSAAEGTKAVSHAEQLSLSRCARESDGKLWCGTCHNPHAASDNRPQQVRQTCLTCHASLFSANKHAPAEECVSCHMPRIRPSNVAHAAITNHLISIPTKQPESNAKTIGARLTAWRTPAPEFADRNLGLALFATGSIQDYGKIFQAYQILSHLPQRDAEVMATLGSILLEQRHADFAVNLYRQALAAAPGNARYSYVLGSAQYMNGEGRADMGGTEGAAMLGNTSVASYYGPSFMIDDLIYHYAQGDQQAAIAELRHSIQLDRSLPAPYVKLMEIYGKLKQPELSRQVRDEYLKFMPQNMSFREVGR